MHIVPYFELEFWGIQMKLCLSHVLLCCGFLLSSQSYALGYSDEYMPCMKASNNQTIELQSCQLDEYKVQEKRLKKILKLTNKISTNEEQQLIERSQNQWLRQREMACNLKDKKLKELNFASMSCALQMTQSRADILETRLNNKALAR